MDAGRLRPPPGVDVARLLARRGEVPKNFVRSQAIENIDAILDVPRMDAIYVGPADLAFSLGKTPMLDSEDAEQLGMYEVLSGWRHKALGPDFSVSVMIAAENGPFGHRPIPALHSDTGANGPGVRIRLAPAASHLRT